MKKKQEKTYLIVLITIIKLLFVTQQAKTSDNTSLKQQFNGIEGVYLLSPSMQKNIKREKQRVLLCQRIERS